MSVSVFVCAGCGSPITATPLRLVEWPPEQEDSDRARQVKPGECFVALEPKFTTIGTATSAPIALTSRGCVVVHPDDVVGVRWYDEQGPWSGCCGPDGIFCYLNLVCQRCDAEIGTFYGDCWTPYEVRIEPGAVVSGEIDEPVVVDEDEMWPPGIENYPRAPKPRPSLLDRLFWWI